MRGLREVMRFLSGREGSKKFLTSPQQQTWHHSVLPAPPPEHSPISLTKRIEAPPRGRSDGARQAGVALLAYINFPVP